MKRIFGGGGGASTSTQALTKGSIDVFISHYTKDDSHDVFNKVDAFLSAKDKRVFNPTTHLSHVVKVRVSAMVPLC